MPDDLKYGPQPFVTDSNPGWDRRPPDNLMTPPELYTHTPAYPLDLYHLSQQDFAKDEDAMKRWFLTAFVAPEDRHLLSPPADSKPAMQALNAIKQALEAPARECTDASLQALRQKILALFQQDKWLGVALQMVDNKALSIDMLNTLIQWQALKIQFGEKFFSLNTDATTGINQPTVQHIVFAQAQLTLAEIRQSVWGTKIEQHRKDLWKNLGGSWEPTLKNFQHELISNHTHMSDDETSLCFKSPSTLLVAHGLRAQNQPSHIIPLYSFGYLTFEDFCAAAFLGGRPMQQYLHTGKGNLYWAHNNYYGEALMVHHDHIHAQQYPSADKPTLQKTLKVLSIIANMFVRTGLVSDANNTIDSFTRLMLDEVLIPKGYRTADQLLQKRTQVLTAIYHEFALAAGVNLAFSCSVDKNNADIFYLKAMHQGQARLFTVDLTKSQYLDNFNIDFNEIQALAKNDTNVQVKPGFFTRYNPWKGAKKTASKLSACFPRCASSSVSPSP